MSINQFSSDAPESLWWARQHMTESPRKNSSQSNHNNFLAYSNTPATGHNFWGNPPHYHHSAGTVAAGAAMFGDNGTGFNLNHNYGEENEDELEEQLTEERGNLSIDENEEVVQKDYLFEKALTPSDVGKLNRLVIPKQHAEKHFPLCGGGDSGEKGMLLSFEDESGKSWKFRYSYWNSSQSYVLTKGWSRFVKEKRLDAGDVIVFYRLGDRLFVGWRRRSSDALERDSLAGQPPAGGGGFGWSQVGHSRLQPYHAQQPHDRPCPPYQPDCLHAGSGVHSQTSGHSRKLRLFGVNLECQSDESEPPTPDGSSQSQACYQHPYCSNVSSYNHYDRTEYLLL